MRVASCCSKSSCLTSTTTFHCHRRHYPCLLRQVFLFLTLNLTATHQQVLERVKEQLKSLIAREDPASVYAVLCHARLLVSRAPMIFENDYTAFYCRSHDSW